MCTVALESFLATDTNRHHVDGFDHLLRHSLPEIIGVYGTFTSVLDGKKFEVRLTDVVSSPTCTTVSECYTFGLNFLVCIRARLTLYVDGAETSHATLPIAHLPAMTGRTVLAGSTYTDNEPFSGLFITKGKCRTIPPTKNIVHNTPVLTSDRKTTKIQIRSSHPGKVYRSTSTLDMAIDKLGTIRCHLPFQTSATHIRVLLLALGATHQDILGAIRRIAGSRYDAGLFYPLEVSLQFDHPEIATADDAILSISRQLHKTDPAAGLAMLRNEVLPHIGAEFRPKWQYLCLCATQLYLCHLGKVPARDRDEYALSHITTSADHLGSLFRLLFIAHMRTCGKLLRRAIGASGVASVCLEKVYGEHRLSARLISAVSSGNWSTIRKGVSINLVSNNYDAIEAQLRRVSSSLVTTSGNHTAPRNVAPDQYGFICAASTPDGETTGLIYELAITASISPPVAEVASLNLLLRSRLARHLQAVDAWLLSPRAADMYQYLDASGGWSGCTDDPTALVDGILRLRRRGGISPYVFVERNDAARTIRVTHESGVLYRPLLIRGRQQDIRPGMGFGRLVAEGIVEFVSPAQQASLCRIAVSPGHVTAETTHIELTQASFLGKLAASVAFVTGQQGPRLAYSTLQRRQIITGGQKRYRGANETNQLWNTNRPLVRTRCAQALPETASIHRNVPVVLAFLAMPQNQEDAIIVKQGTLDRGAFRMSDSREYQSEASASSAGSQSASKFERPVHATARRTTSYEHIEDNGLPLPGTRIPGGDVVIGKTITTRSSSAARTSDISTCTKQGDTGVVTRSESLNLPTGQRVRVQVTVSRRPEVGDKFTSQYAQKGVIGAVWQDADMPFSERTGMAPDLVVSPLSMTSRMTMSSLLEALCGKAMCTAGDYDLGLDHQDYQGSNTRYHKVFESELVRHGFCHDGTETFIDGRTGRSIDASVFVGVVDYYRLVHIASKKIHARSTGPRDPITRQPRDGRRFGGGLRVGEMESAALAAHGGAYALRERFREMSDMFEIYVCSACQLTCDDVCPDINYHYCRRCRSTETVRAVRVPFTFLVLTLELFATGIVTKLQVE